MKDMKISVRKSESVHEREGAFSVAYPHLAACYYRFGYVRLAVEAGRK